MILYAALFQTLAAEANFLVMMILPSTWLISYSVLRFMVITSFFILASRFCLLPSTL